MDPRIFHSTALSRTEVDALADDGLPVLRTRSTATAIALRTTPDHIAILTDSGVRELSWPAPRPATRTLARR